MSDKLDLNTLSQQLGIKLKHSNSGDLQAQTSQPEAASIVGLEADSQAVETNPLFKMLLLGGILFGTVGFGLIAMLWGAGDNTQQAKKADTLPKEQVAAAVDRQKEVADLKASLVMNQQKLDATRLTAAKNPTAAATPTTTPTTATPTTATPTIPSQVPVRPAQPSIASATTKPVATMQPSPQDTAQLAALERAKQQETAQLATLRQSKQQETTQLAALERAKQQETAQLATLRQSKQQETTQLAALERAKQQGTAQLAALRQSMQQGTGQLATLRQAGQQQATQLGGLTDRVKKERQSLATLRQQRNSTSVVAKIQSPLPTRVAQRQTIAANYQPPTAQKPKMSWEEASALASYGGQEPEPAVNGQNGTIQPVSSLVNALAISPLLRLPVGQVVGGRLVTPFYTLISSSNGQQASQKTSATVTIDKAIEVGSGWRLPAGTAIEFDFQLADNGMIQATSKKVTYGNTEIPMLPGAFILTGNDNQPLFAQIKEVNSDKLAAADLNSAIFGGAAEVGNVLVNSGSNSSVSIGGGTAIATTNNGNPNILGAVFKGAFSPLTQTQISRSQAIATRLEKQSKVGYLTPGTTMQVYVALAATFQIPTDNPLIQASNPFQTGASYAPTTRIALIPSRFPPDMTLSSEVMPAQTPGITSLSNPYSPTLAQPPVGTPTFQSPPPQPILTVNPTQGQVVIQSPRGIPVQIAPLQLPNIPTNVRSIFPR